MLDSKTGQSSELPGSGGLCFPRWSPDRRYIVGIPFDATRLLLFDFKTHQKRELVNGVGTVGYFSWSTDSEYVYFDSFLSPEASYFRIRLKDSTVERIASLTTLRRYISDFGAPWSGLGPASTPIFTRDISTQEIYELDWQLH